jgi:hypothetical protein
MEVIRTEFFDLVTDADLNTTKSYDASILYCNKCKHFFFTKACGGRNIFESSSIYHPTDGNCVIAEVGYEGNELYADYDCQHEFETITTVKRLKELTV